MKQRNQHNSAYTKAHEEWIKVRCESTANNTAIARQFLKEFDVEGLEIESVRMKISRIRAKTKNKKEKYKVKRLFYDIETGYFKAPVWQPFQQFVAPEKLEGEKKIICISYKWQYEDRVHTLKWDENCDDKELLRKFIRVLGEADEVCAHNGDRFDMKIIRARAMQQGLLMYPKYRSIDTLKKARKFFKFASNKLDFLGRALEVGKKLEHAGFDLWRRCQEGYSEKEEITGSHKKIRRDALKEMVAYCEQDVLLLEDVYNVMMPYIDHNTNYAVLKGGAKWQCPECGGKHVELSHTDTTPLGYIKRHMRCVCKKTYHISNRSYQQYLVRDLEVIE